MVGGWFSEGAGWLWRVYMGWDFFFFGGGGRRCVMS